LEWIQLMGGKLEELRIRKDINEDATEEDFHPDVPLYVTKLPGKIVHWTSAVQEIPPEPLKPEVIDLKLIDQWGKQLYNYFETWNQRYQKKSTKDIGEKEIRGAANYFWTLVHTRYEELLIREMTQEEDAVTPILQRWQELLQFIRWGRVLSEEILEDIAVPLSRVGEIRAIIQHKRAFNWNQISLQIGTNPKKTRECWESYIEYLRTTAVPDNIIADILACETFEDAKWIAPEYQGERLAEIWQMKTPQRHLAPRTHPALLPGVRITLATDGASSRNPGPSGWGVVMKQGDFEQEFWGGQPHSTNNLMELRAVIEGLSRTPEGAQILIITDSRYVE
jgi:hypothetical protein